MGKERRYQEDEVRQILGLAVGQEDGPAQLPPAADGLTLLELQEVGREINTTGSKSNDAALTRLVLDAKGILEQMREQAANVA